MSCKLRFVLAFSFALLSAVCRGEPATDDPPSAEGYLALNSGPEYLAAAKSWLDAHPRHELAPRVAGELLMTATLLKVSEEIRLAKLRLLADYPGSLATRHLTTQIPLDSYREFLEGCFADFDWQQPHLRRRFNQAVENGNLYYGPKYADDRLLQYAVLAATDPAKGRALRGAIRLENPESARTLDVALDATLTPAAKLRQLQSDKTRSAGIYMRLLYTAELTEEQRSSPELVGLVAERMIEDRSFARLKDIFAKVCAKSPDARLLYLLAWGQAASGDSPAAAASLEKLCRQFPDSPWAVPARELLPAIRNLEKNLADHQAGLEGAVQALTKTPPEVVEMNLRSGPQAATPFRAYVAVNVSKESLELHIEKNQKLVAAVQASRTLDRIYLKGDTEIRTFSGDATIPYFAPSLRQKENGNWYFNFELGESPEASPLLGNLRSFFASPMFRPRNPAIMPQIYVMVEQGRFPAEVRSVDGHKIYRWLAPQLDSPELQTIELRLDQHNYPVSLASSGLFSAEFRCGPAAEISLQPPKWPDLPVANESSIIQAGTQLMGLGIELYCDLENLANGKDRIAGKNSATRR